MTLRLPILGVLLLVLASGTAAAEGPVEIVVKITPQVVERDQSVTWEQPLTQITRPGTPVVVNIDAESLSIRVTVTPFLRGKDFLLVVQGEVRQVGGSGARGSTSLQSLLVPSGEPIAFFPLGRSPGDGRQMIVLIRVEQQHE